MSHEHLSAQRDRLALLRIRILENALDIISGMTQQHVSKVGGLSLIEYTARSLQTLMGYNLVGILTPDGEAFFYPEPKPDELTNHLPFLEQSLYSQDHPKILENNTLYAPVGNNGHTFASIAISTQPSSPITQEEREILGRVFTQLGENLVTAQYRQSEIVAIPRPILELLTSQPDRLEKDNTYPMTILVFDAVKWSAYLETHNHRIAATTIKKYFNEAEKLARAFNGFTKFTAGDELIVFLNILGNVPHHAGAGIYLAHTIQRHFTELSQTLGTEWAITFRGGITTGMCSTVVLDTEETKYLDISGGPIGEGKRAETCGEEGKVVITLNTLNCYQAELHQGSPFRMSAIPLTDLRKAKDRDMQLLLITAASTTEEDFLQQNRPDPII